MLGEILLDELRERQRLREAVCSAQLVERALERRLRVLLAGEAAVLDSLRAATADAVPVGPLVTAVASNGCELEYLSLLDHPTLLVRLPIRGRWRFDGSQGVDRCAR